MPRAADSQPYGRCIVLKHAVDGLAVSTVYAFLSAVGVKVGDRVVQGQILGLSGTSGSPAEQHLHITVKVAGAQTGAYPPGIIDPINLLVRPALIA